MLHQPIVIPGVDWQDTFVLGWRQEHERLVFSVLASLWPGHPSYTPPPPGDWTCYRAAELIFDGATNVTGLKEMKDVRPTIDPDGSADYGNIDWFSRNDDGTFTVSGDFGEVRVTAEGMRLAVEDSA
jgi:hypothetical protein